MEKILITGGNGHLGGRLARYLEAQGHSVVLGLRKKTPLQNRPQVQLNFEEDTDFTSVVKGITTVLHLAALNAQDCEKDPARAQKINVEGTQRLLAACKTSAVKKFIYFSTIHVYGTPLKGELKESGPCHPQSVYARTHFEAEAACADFAGPGRTSLSLRLSNSLGSPLHPDVNTWMLIANDLCRQAVTKEKLGLKSSGIQQRNFVAIAEIERFVGEQLKKSELPQGPLNFGSPRTLSIWELAQIIHSRAEKFLNKKIPLERVLPSSEEKIVNFHFSLELLKLNGFEPAADLTNEIDELLKRCHLWFG